MQTVILVIHVLLAISLIGIVLVQKSEGGGLGMGGGGGMSGFMTGRSAANLLTRTTGILFAAFVGTSILLALLAAHHHSTASAVLDRLAAPAAPVSKPAAPSVPLAQ